MKIFVVGGTGVLGRRIVPLLVANGHQVTVMARNPTRGAIAHEQGAEVAMGDVLEPYAAEYLVEAVQPDLIMHQLTDLSERSSAANARIRIEGTRHVVDAAKAAGVERIVVQSIAWCYGPGDRPANEDEPLDLGTADPARRATVEAVHSMEQAAAELPHAVVLRNGLLYGPGTWYAHGGAMADAARRTELPADAAVSSFVHVDDAAMAAVEAIDWPAGPVNIVDGEPAPALAWVPLFTAVVGAPVAIPVGGEAPAWARGASGAYAHSLGWEPRYATWREGFRTGLG